MTGLIVAAVAAAAFVQAASGADAGARNCDPRFEWRGHMLDVSRHFFTVEDVKRTLDLMHEHDLNVFHWHLTDGEGWRLQIDRYPKLTTVGAVRKASSKRMTTMGLDVVDGDYGPFFYTKDQVREIVRYAAERGIRIVPEIEIPGHSAAAIRAYPELGCSGCGNSGEYCLGKESTFETLQNILDEVVELFPGEVIHIGGDECAGGNWKKCADCQARIKELGLRDSHDLQGWATKRFAEYLAKKGRRLMGWDELATWDDLPRSVIIQSYRGASYGVAAAKKGFDVVMSPDVFCYLDYVQGLKDDPEEYQPFGVLLDVGKIARFDPCDGVPEEFRRHILGGQGNLWTELVPDRKAAEWRTWPRLAALADVLKNGPAKDVPAFMARMQSIRDGLVRRGVNAAPLGPLFKPVPDLLPGARYESLKSENGKRLDFAKMLDNPLDFSVLRFDLENKDDSFRHVFATRDASMEKGTYRLDLNFDRISMSAPDDEGFKRGLAQLRALARPKRGGAMEFTGAVIVGGPQM
ncbi:MAG: family 20 glycosylhydrolase [Kiritimatiellae bacterium]|nr:family 20 glycosylhydrolase [Kiritimatiellia bacterium]